jgi:hypothetical protein
MQTGASKFFPRGIITIVGAQTKNDIINFLNLWRHCIFALFMDKKTAFDFYSLACLFE